MECRKRVLQRMKIIEWGYKRSVLLEQTDVFDIWITLTSLSLFGKCILYHIHGYDYHVYEKW